MKKVFLLLICCCYCSVIVAQVDTLYVYFEDKEPNYVINKRKANLDPDPRTYFPFNGGCLYEMPKKEGKYMKEVGFGFFTHTLEEKSPYKLDYQIVDKSILKEKDFKDREWVDKTSYKDIQRILGKEKGKKKVIMLLDGRYMDMDTVFLVKVHFSSWVTE